MKITPKEVQDVKTSLTDSDYIFSDSFRDYLQRTTRNVTKNYDITVVYSGKIATDNKTMWLNPAFPEELKLNSLSKKVLLMIGCLAHESFHIEYSDFDVLKQAFKKKNFQAKILHTIANIIEDAYVEKRGKGYYVGLFSVGIDFLNERLKSRMNPIEKSPPTAPFLGLFLQVALSYCVLKMDNFKILNPEVREAFDKTKPLFAQAIVEPDARTRIEYAEKIAQIIKSFIKEAKNDPDQKVFVYFQNPKDNQSVSGEMFDETVIIPTKQASDETGSMPGKCENDEPDTDTGDQADEQDDNPEGEKDSEKTQDQDGSRDSADKQESEFDDEQNGSGSPVPEQDGEPDEEQCGSDSFDDSEIDQDNKTEESQDAEFDDFDSGQDVKPDVDQDGVDDSSTEQNNESNHSDSEQCVEPNANQDDFSDSDSGLDDDSDENQDDFGLDVEPDKEQDDSNICGTDQDDEPDKKFDKDQEAELVKNSLDALEQQLEQVKTDAAKQICTENRARLDNKQWQDDSKKIAYSVLHKGIETRCIFDTNQTANFSHYVNDKTKLSPIINSSARKFKEILKYNEDVKLSGLCEGRLDRNKLFRPDNQFFYKRREKSEESDLAILLAVDLSGSMDCGDRFDNVRKAVVILTEICSSLKVPLAIVGHKARSGRAEVTHYHIKNFDTPISQSALYRYSFYPSENTREGLSLRYCGEYILRRSETDKLVFSISDGGTEHDTGSRLTGYTGESAQKDVRKEAAYLERLGVNVIGVAIGTEAQEITKNYPHSIVVPKTERLADMIISELRKKIFRF